MATYKLRKIRKNRYAKIIDNEIVGIATVGEVFCYFYSREHSEIDAGIIEVSLALTAIAALLATVSMAWYLRLPAAFAFLLGFFATQLLYWAYIYGRIPGTVTAFISSSEKKKNPKLGILIWLIIYYPKLLLRSISESGKVLFYLQITELGYLTLLGAMLITGGSIIIFIMGSIIPDLIG